MVNPNAPLHARQPRADPASPAPDIPFRNGTTRRGLLGWAAALWAGPARAQAQTLTAGPGGYNGASPGPELRTRVGQPLRFAFVNALARPTSLRLSGFVSDAVPPGARRDVIADPRSRFDLYGPFGAEEPGLFGATIADDGAPADLDLVALLTGASATLRREARPGARVRLRIANAAPETALMLRAEGCEPRVVAVDGYPCEPFAPRDGAIPLCPGARFELMFDLDAPFTLSGPGGSLVALSPAGERLPRRPPPTALPADPRLPEDIALEKALQVKIKLGSKLNGRTLFSVTRGRPVTLTLVNNTSSAETLRLEAHAARLLHALDDGYDPYWRDVLYLDPGQTVHAAFVADAPGRWPLASVSARRRAKGAITWFMVT